MKQRIFSHFQDYLIQNISLQYQDLLYCNSSQYILSTYNSQHNNNNNVVLFGSCTMSSTLITILAYSLLTQHYYIIGYTWLFNRKYFCRGTHSLLYVIYI